jgi:uncharacterized protein (DUF305 family)
LGAPERAGALGADLTRRGGSTGPALFALVLLLALAGCSSSPPPQPPPQPAYNDVDVMFLQMSLAQTSEGDRVAAVAERQAVAPELRAVAAELRGRWRAETATMRGWLTGWRRPLTPDPDSSAHAGHGDLHSLRPADITDLSRTTGADFDRTAVSMLLGTLHNSVETYRMESGGGRYPPALNLATTMTRSRQGTIQTLLALAAQP